MAAASPRFGLWVEAEGKNQPFRTKEDFESFLTLTGAYPFTDLYCQVYRGGRSWFRSTHADDAPYQDALRQGFDPLRDTIAQAKARGQRVHAWLNVLRIDRNFTAPILLRVGPKAVLVDSYGNSLLDYSEDGFPPGKIRNAFRLDTPGIWMDPSVPEVRQNLAAMVGELVKNYPGLSGVHFDMIRFPFAQQYGETRGGPLPDFPYGEAAKQVLFAETGLPVRIVGGVAKVDSEPTFQHWRRVQISRLVFEMRSAVKRISPSMEISAAVIASAELGQTKVFQDWKLWLRQRMADAVVLMNYTEDDLVAEQNTRAALNGMQGAPVIIGLGAWLHLKRPLALVRQAEYALHNGAAGVVLFSYSNLFSAQGRELLRRFSSSLFGSSQQIHQNKMR